MSEWLTTGQMIDKLKVGEVAVVKENLSEVKDIKINEDKILFDGYTYFWADGQRFYLNDFTAKLKWLITPQYELNDLSDKVRDLTTQLEREQNAKEKAQMQYVETFDRLEKADYELNNCKEALKTIKGTLELYELENKALRELVRVWV